MFSVAHGYRVEREHIVDGRVSTDMRLALRRLGGRIAAVRPNASAGGRCAGAKSPALTFRGTLGPCMTASCAHRGPQALVGTARPADFLSEQLQEKRPIHIFS